MSVEPAARHVPASVGSGPEMRSMKNRRVFLVALLILAVGNQFCGHCENETLADVQSHGPSRAQAQLFMRRCGSVEGWVVKVSSAQLKEREVFMGRMPPPTSVEDAKDEVTIRWGKEDTLFIRGPRWIETMSSAKNYGSIKIRYEATESPYPKR